MITVGSDYSGVGAFIQALRRLGITFHETFACEMDKFARETYIKNYGNPEYFPTDVYERGIPVEPLDIYMTTPPCQAFSIAGKRKGEDDKRGILFYNSHEFIKKNKPKYFIFENVKGLLSDDNGKTFAKWVQYLGGKSVNGLPTIFPHPESVKYHIYWCVLNAKNYGIPQNRERIFIVGIRDDHDNMFTWPKEEILGKRLKDVLENNVAEKYYLSDEMTQGLMCEGNKTFINQNTQASQVYYPDYIGQTLCAGTHGYANGYVGIGRIVGRPIENPKLRKAGLPTQQILEINHNGTSNTLTTVQKDNVVVEKINNGYLEQVGSLYENNNDAGRVYSENGISCTIKSVGGGLGAKTGLYKIGFRIRRLTPRECFRLMDYPDSFTWSVSDSQAYKQAGNSICVGVLSKIIAKLKLSNESEIKKAI